MPFRPESIIVHEDVQSSYDSWEALAKQNQQPAQAVWKSLLSCIQRLRNDGQWGEVI
jgi:hypothetical protein